MATQVQRGDPITAEWANSLFNPLNSYVGEGYVDKDRIVVVPGNGGGEEESFDRITGLTTAAVTEGNTTITIDNIKVLSGADPRDDPTSSIETLIGTKPSSWTADADKKAWLEWNKTDETWDAYQLDGCSVPS